MRNFDYVDTRRVFLLSMRWIYFSAFENWFFIRADVHICGVILYSTYRIWLAVSPYQRYESLACRTWIQNDIDG